MSTYIFILILALHFLLSHPCPDGWHSSAFNDKCYLVVTEKKVWFDAEGYCRSAASDGHLTSITNGFEQNNIDCTRIFVLNDIRTEQLPIFLQQQQIKHPASFRRNFGLVQLLLMTVASFRGPMANPLATQIGNLVSQTGAGEFKSPFETLQIRKF